MKRGGPLKRKTPLKSKKKINVVGHSDTATIKKDIQRLLREIVIKRDGGCILRNVRNCNGLPGQAVLQADHLITRANAATYGEPRLVVCVCRSCHYWKSVGSNRNKEQYDQMVWKLLPADRASLWQKCKEASWMPTRKYATDWRLVQAHLKQELEKMAV